jgi:membrane protein
VRTIERSSGNHSAAPSRQAWWTFPLHVAERLRRWAVKLVGAAKFRFLRNVGSLLGQAGSGWLEDNATSMGAALAFYTIFSLVPVLIIATTVAGLAFGQHAARREILLQLQSVFGQSGAGAVQGLIQSKSALAPGWATSTVGILTLLVGASGAFVELQDGLNKIWKVARPSRHVLLTVIQQRFFSLGLVLGVGFLLMVSLVLSAGLHALGTLVGHVLRGSPIEVNLVKGFVSWAVVALLLLLIYKYLPDAYVAWGDVWFGAGVASLLFTGGKVLIGLYLGHSTMASAYGAAGSLVILLVWIYYAAQILLLGAEVTYVYANRYGSRSAPPRRVS